MKITFFGLLIAAKATQATAEGSQEDVDPSTICGPTDDRILSRDVRQGRLAMPRDDGRVGKCTAWLISESVFLTASHCGLPKDNWRVHFTFGASDAPLKDQYAVELSSYRRGWGDLEGGSDADDWAVGRLLPNPTTLKLPGVVQSSKCKGKGCGWYTLGDVPSQAGGNSITITGYGRFEDRYPQTTHTGDLMTIGTEMLYYSADTTGGDSGAPILVKETGKAIGIHTIGECTSLTGKGNSGVRIDVPNLKRAISEMIPTSKPTSKPTFKPTYQGKASKSKSKQTEDAYDGAVEGMSMSIGNMESFSI